MRLLYLRAAFIKICREMAGLDTDDLEESDPCADMEEDEDELEDNELILEDC